MVNQLPEQTNWWGQGFRGFEDIAHSFVLYSGIDDDASNYGYENPSIVHDEAGLRVQPS